MEVIQSLKDAVIDLISTEKRSKEKLLSKEKKEQLDREFEFLREQIRRGVEVHVFTNFSQAVQADDLKIPDVNLHFKDVEIRGDVAQPEMFVKAPVVHLEMSPEDVILRITELDGMNNTEPGRFIPVEWKEDDTVKYDDETGLYITNFMFKVHTDLYKMDPPSEETEEAVETTVEQPPEDPEAAEEATREQEEAALKLEQDAAAKAEEEAKLLKDKEESDIRAAEAAKLQEEEAAKAKVAKEAEEKAANHSTSKKKKF